MSDRLAACLHALTHDPDAATVERFEAFQAGGGGTVSRPPLRREHVTVDPSPEGIALTFTHAAPTGEPSLGDPPPPVFLEATPAMLGLPTDWRAWRSLLLTLVNGERDLELTLAVVGARSRLMEHRRLRANETAELAIDLADLPLIQGKQTSWSPEALRLIPRFPDDGQPRRLHVQDLALVGRTEPGPVLDGYGQRIHAWWPGKIRSDADLIAAREAESTALLTLAPPLSRSRYGGWTGGPHFNASGFFRVEQDPDGRWWYIDPEGWPFWSFGATCVRVTDDTIVAGREALFADLPDRNHFPEAWDKAPGLICFHAANVRRKYGSLANWAEQVRLRLGRWGVNTVANWSQLDLIGRQGLVYVDQCSSGSPELLLRDIHLPDVFAPSWENLLRTRFTAFPAPNRGNPWLLGYFVDNELGWGALSEDIAAAYAERYFSTIRRLLKEADPDHLYLGCRFTRGVRNRAVIRAAGAYSDVVTVNAYSLVPGREEFDLWHAWCGRPLQIGEHQLALIDPRQPPPIWTAFSADERRHWWETYDQTAARMPYCIGSHWFQYADQAGTGRSSNGENMLIGLVDIADNPYPHLVDAARAIGAGIYRWHQEGR